MKAKKLTQAEKIRRALAADPNAPLGDIAKKLGVRYQTVWTIKKNMAKAVKATKKDGLRRNPKGKILMQTAPVVGTGFEYEQKDGTWQVVAVATSDTPVKADNVNHPAHYKVGGIETIDFIEAKQLNYHLGNVVKYVTRADHKGERLENLKKAQWYLNREIAKAEGAQS